MQRQEHGRGEERQVGEHDRGRADEHQHRDGDPRPPRSARDEVQRGDPRARGDDEPELWGRPIDGEESLSRGR